MTRSMTHRTPIFFFHVALAALATAACGGGTDLEGTIEVSEGREARVTLTPALDVSALIDPSFAERIEIEHIAINLEDARLLTIDPSIPPGGFALLENAEIIGADGAQEFGIALPFPERLLALEDLAVYLKIGPTAVLDDASVVIRARLYATASGKSALVSAQDPDGDPANEENQDPDGDPAKCAQDPDGDPAMCQQKRSLVTQEPSSSISFELRSNDIADLVTTLRADSPLDVVVGIPATRWLTVEVMDQLDASLRSSLTETETEATRAEQTSDTKTIVVEAERHADDGRAEHGQQDRMENTEGRDEYFLGEGEAERLKTGRPR